MPSLGASELLPHVEGKVSARLSPEDDEGDLVVIRFDAELSMEGDAIDLIEEDELRSGRDPQEYESASVDLTLKGEGVLHWDVARGCFAAFEFEAEVETSLDAEWIVEAMGGELDLAAFTSRSGTLTYKFSCADA